MKAKLMRFSSRPVHADDGYLYGEPSSHPERELEGYRIDMDIVCDREAFEAFVRFARAQFGFDVVDVAADDGAPTLPAPPRELSPGEDL